MKKNYIRSQVRIPQETWEFLEELVRKRKIKDRRISINTIICEIIENYKKKCEKVLTIQIDDDTIV